VDIRAKGRGSILAIAVLVLAATLVQVSAAFARTVPVYSYTGQYYDGTGSTAGTLVVGTDVAASQTTQRVYVTDPSRLEGSLSQFDASGNPVAFSSLGGATSIRLELGGAERVAVDNSSTVSAGNIYAMASSVVKGFRPDGSELEGAFPIGGFQASCGLGVDMEGDIWVVDNRRNVIIEYASSGAPTGRTLAYKPFSIGGQNATCDLAFDSHDNLYLIGAGPSGASGQKYAPDGTFVEEFAGGSFFGAPQSVDVDLATDHVFVLQTAIAAEYDAEIVEYDDQGEAITSFGAPDPAHSFQGLLHPPGFALGQGGQVYVSNSREYSGVSHVEIFAPSGQALVPTVKTDLPSLEPTSVTLKGSVDLDGGGDATSCFFEWGTTGAYGESSPCVPAGPISGPGVHMVTAHLTGLTQGTRYHYRLVAKTAGGMMAFGRDRAFRPQGPLTMSPTVVSEVNTDGALLTAEIDPNGGETTYFVEYGPDDCQVSTCAQLPVQPATLPNALGTQAASVRISGLGNDSTFHYRFVARNESSEVVGTEDTFRTYAVESTKDLCANALLRKDTGGVLLPDCRAYELVSAANAGGYDVVSDAVAGQVPLSAKPRAKDGVLYSISNGKIPGVGGEPTNRGLDPYVARRTADGWVTTYAGIAVGAVPYQSPFASSLLEASDGLSTFAFGGPEVCNPCFADGKTGVPVRRDEGPLTQGMAGALDPGSSAAPDGYVGRHLSGDGTHLVFGSASAFEEGAAGNGDVSIYDRNLATGATHIVSKTPAGANLPCLQGPGTCHSPGNPHGIGALDVSEDGSRIVVAQRVSTDPAGNDYWHPYMTIGDAAKSVDLAPGTVSGVLYAGMSSDGSRVFYTTTDALTADDHDSSADLYMATVDPDGGLTLTRVSSGAGSGDSDSCDPVPGQGNNWNSVGASSPDGCGVVAFAGGAGVARGTGTVYFLSPEKLDDSGTLNQPNLYVATPGGTPRRVATIEPTNSAITHAVYDNATPSFGDIQVVPSGDFAAFASAVPLTGYPTFGHSSIYRYSLPSVALDCVSCPRTRASLTADTHLSSHGLNLSDDGRVFFTSIEPLSLRDTGSKPDVYEWNNGTISLLSTGRSATDIGLLSVSADGVNAFFFTRDTLVRNDHNGNTMKIYVAREGGGIPVPVSAPDCQASDECHGPGSAAPPAQVIPTFEGTGGNVVQAKKRKKRKHHRRRHRKGAKRGAERGSR
jgi:hypothetical protein